MDAEVVKKAKLRRISNILGILITGYHASKRVGKLTEWKAFIKDVSKDPFFHSLYPDAYKENISTYYRWLGKLIMNGNVCLLAWTLDTYQWYTEHIKYKK